VKTLCASAAKGRTKDTSPTIATKRILVFMYVTPLRSIVGPLYRTRTENIQIGTPLLIQSEPLSHYRFIRNQISRRAGSSDRLPETTGCGVRSGQDVEQDRIAPVRQRSASFRQRNRKARISHARVRMSSKKPCRFADNRRPIRP